MSVISCKLRREGQRLSIGDDGNRTYAHEWLVQTNSGSMGLISILAGALTAGPDPIPQHQSVYNVNGDSDMGALLQEVEVVRIEQENNLFFYTIRGTWKPPKKGQGREPLPDNPLDWPVKWHCETSKFTRKAIRDLVDDRLLVNAAGDLFDIEVDDGREIITAVRNEWPLLAIFHRMRWYKNAVASDYFMGAEPYASKMDSVTMGELSVSNDVEYYPVTYRIEFAEEGKTWRKRYDNRGNMAYDKPKASGGTKSRVRNLSGGSKGEFRDWAYLDANGVQLPDPDPTNLAASVIPWPPESQAPYHLNVVRPFAPLGLG